MSTRRAVAAVALLVLSAACSGQAGGGGSGALGPGGAPDAGSAAGDLPQSLPSATPAAGNSASATPARLLSIALSPSPVTLPSGATRQLTATGTYEAAPARDVTGVVHWTSADPSTASVDAGGLVTGVTPGTTTIAGSVGAVAQTVSVTVGAGVQSVAIFPPRVTFPLDRSLQLAAIATLSDGTKVAVTNDAAWATSDADAISVMNGKLAPQGQAGIGANATITASYAGWSGTAVATLDAASAPIGPDYDGDPLLPQQWHIRNTGQSAYAAHFGIAGYDLATTATYQAGFSGRGVKVAVVDTGLEIAHEDLAANVIPGSWNFIDSTTDPTSTATDGDHGTSVSGILAAVRGNGKGGMGVAPGAQLNGYNYVASDGGLASFVSSYGSGDGTGGPLSEDVWVFNSSWGFGSIHPWLPTDLEEGTFLDGVTNLRGGLGAVYVQSAGNGFGSWAGSPTNPDCTGANGAGLTCQNASIDPFHTLPMNIVVGATNASGKKASYASAGAAIWISAPGGEGGYAAGALCSGLPCVSYAYDPAIVTTDQSGCAAGFARTGVTTNPFNAGASGNGDCSYWNGMNGTSSAAPNVSAVVALVLEANPSLGWRDVKHVLASTARQLDAGIAPVVLSLSGGTYVAEPGWTMNAAGYQFHDWYGFGAVDADTAVAMARTYVPGSLGTFRDTGWLTGTVNGTGSIPDNSAVGATGSIAIPAGPVVEAVQVRIQTNHPWIGDLGVELTSPAGTRSVLLNARNGFGSNSGTVTVQLLTNALYAEPSDGTWSLKVVDGWSKHGTGQLVSWQIRIYGH